MGQLYHCWCCYVVITVLVVGALSGNYEYRVQESPITFMNHLKSQILFTGDDLILHCNISLRSTSPVLFQWRHNGRYLQNGVSVSIHQNQVVTSELMIKNLSLSEEGGYECLVLDGLVEGESSAFITVSNIAQIEVIDRSSLSGVSDVKKKIGEYLLLHCNITHLENVTWRKNGLNLLPGSASLIVRSGSILIFNLTKQDEGTYQCFTRTLLYGVLYNLSLTESITSVQPWLLIDPADHLVSHEDRTTISCCVLGTPLHYELTWLRRDSSGNSQEVLRSQSSEFCNQLVVQVETLESGYYEYECRIMLNNTSTLTTSSTLRIEDIPSISDSHRVRDLLTSQFNTEVSIDCPLSTGSNVEFKWFKNGADITVSSDPSTGYLSYIKSEDESVFGIYQCFVKNGVGSDYATVRYLDRGFANPPEDLTCHAQDQSFNIDSPPKVVLNWNFPNLNTSAIEEFIAVYKQYYNKDIIYHTGNTFLEIDLDFDVLGAEFQVYVKNSISPHLKNGTKAFCEISSTLERRTLPNNARGVTLMCPSSQLSGSVRWDNPDIPKDIEAGLFIGVDLKEYHIHCLCLHKMYTKECGNYEQSAPEILNRTISFILDRQPQGSFCFVGGMYSFKSLQSSPLIIPTKVCKIPVISQDHSSMLLLNISCERSVAIISLNNPVPENISVQVQGHCILEDIISVLTINDTLSSTYSEMVINSSFPKILACSFVASYLNLSVYSTVSEVLQCIVDQYVLISRNSIDEDNATVPTSTHIYQDGHTPPLPTSTHIYQDGRTPPYSTSTFGLPTSSFLPSTLVPLKNPGTSRQAASKILVRALVVIILFFSVIILLVLLVCLSQKRKTTVRNKLWQKAVEAVSDVCDINELGAYVDPADCIGDTHDDAQSIFEHLDFEIAVKNSHIPFLRNDESCMSENSEIVAEKGRFPRDHWFCSNSSGYDTASESTEYFIARDVN